MEKKTIFFGLVVLALLIISILPAVLADNGSDDQQGNGDDSRGKERPVGPEVRQEIRQEIRQEVKQRIEEKREDIKDLKDQLKEKIRKVIVKDFVKKREIAKEKIEKFNDDFLKAKNAYMKDKEDHKKVRDEFIDLKGEYRQCSGNKTNSTKVNCTGLEAKLLEKGKEDLIKLTDRIIDHLNKIKSRVSGADNMNESEANEIVADIDALIAELRSEQDLVNAAKDKDGLKAAADKIRETWKKIDYKAFSYAERVVHTEVGQIYSRSILLEKKLQDVIDRLEANGTNVTAFQAQLDNFTSYVNSAKLKMDDANDMFEEAKALRAGNSTNSTEAAKQKLEEAKNLTRSAHEDLKQAHVVLMQLVKQLNQKGESFNPDKIEDNEMIEISELSEDD
ncbi:MAG: hypothetical protein V1866_04925 [archaeon]